jgi:fumarate reductase iron-sulfur subunit
MADQKMVTLNVTRFDPDVDAAPREQAYTIPFRDDMVVLDALNYIKEHVDGSVTFRWSCRMGVCGSCGMNVNGTPKLTCATFCKEYTTEAIRVEPLANFPVVRDLVVDMTDFMGKLKAVQPWLIRKSEQPVEQGEYRQSPEQLDRFKQYSMCINCMLCYAACPVYALSPAFVGPAALALARRYNLDSRDQGEAERHNLVASEEGIWECTFVGECTVVCPKHVDPAAAIQQAKVDTVTKYWKNILMPWMNKPATAGAKS